MSKKPADKTTFEDPTDDGMPPGDESEHDTNLLLFPHEPAPGSRTAELAHEFNDVLEPLLKSGLLSSAPSPPITNKDLGELVRALDHTILIIDRVTRLVSTPLLPSPRISILLRQLRHEIIRMERGFESEVLKVPENVPKNQRWSDPVFERLRYSCLGYGDVLSKKVSMAEANRIISSALKKNGQKCQPDTMKGWRRTFGPVLDNKHRLEARFDLTGQMEHLKPVPLEKLRITDSTSLEVLEERLDQAIRNNFGTSQP